MSRGESPIASSIVPTLRNRSPDTKNLNTIEAWTSGNLLRDLRDRDVDAPVKEFPTAAPSKLTRKTPIHCEMPVCNGPEASGNFGGRVAS